jgi:DNA invertase Pin-like site-specific DNA recombinase
MLAGFATFERDLIRERQREGITLAKARGVYKGRRKALKPEEVVQLREMADAGMPKSELARTYGISRETVYSYLRAS